MLCCKWRQTHSEIRFEWRQHSGCDASVEICLGSDFKPSSKCSLDQIWKKKNKKSQKFTFKYLKSIWICWKKGFGLAFWTGQQSSVSCSDSVPKNLKFSHHIIISVRTLKRRCLGLSLFRAKQQADWIRGKKCEHQMQGYNLLRGNFFKVLLIVRAGYRTSVLLWHWPFMAVRLHVIAACRKNTYVVTRDTSWLRPQTGFTCICVVNCSCVCVVELVKKCRQKKKKSVAPF